MSDAIAQVIILLLGLAAVALIIGVAAGLLLTVYGIAVVVFRIAYGIELPNPGPWLIENAGWLQRAPG